ncbi:MAG: HlyD family secretion protein, partial [Hyphomicrobium sp.]
LKMAERNYARDMMEQSAVRATRSGIAVFADKRELTGKPVAVGERIMEIADPASIELKIDLPVADAIALKPGARVMAFLDSDPLRPFAGKIDRSDYKARPGEGDVAAFRVIATLASGNRQPPRLGVRGTAQISGDDVALGFFLFRRPIAAARQWTGL